MNKLLTLSAITILAFSHGRLIDSECENFDSGVVIGEPSNAPKAFESFYPQDEYYSKQAGYYSTIGTMQSVWDVTQGEGVTVAIIDSGIDYDHPDFYDDKGNSRILLDYARSYRHVAGNSTSGYLTSDSGFPCLYFTPDKSYKLDGVTITGADVIAHNGDTTHGTSVAGVLAASTSSSGIIGMAPKAKILPIKVDFYVDSIGYALQYIAELNSDTNPNNNVDVVNLSIEAPTTWPSITSAAATLVEQGTILVASAGNSGSYNPSYPAAEQNIIGVGATTFDKDFALADYSNFNAPNATSSTESNNVEVCAPGTVYTTEDGETYKTISGTSFACPIVAGAAALWKSLNKTGTVATFKEKLHNTAYDIGEIGWDTKFGYGQICVDQLLDIDLSLSFIYCEDEDETIELKVGETYQINATVISDSDDIEINYETLDENIEVSSTGLVTAKSVGEDAVIMTADGLEEVDVYFNIVEGDVEPPVVIELDHISASYIGEDLYVGNTLENSDILVTAYYTNGGQEKEVSNFTVSGYSSDTAGIKTVTISYSEDGKTITTTISIEIKEENIPLIIGGEGDGEPVKNELSLGCSGAIVTPSIFISLLSGFGLVLWLKKKRG